MEEFVFVETLPMVSPMQPLLWEEPLDGGRGYAAPAPDVFSLDSFFQDYAASYSAPSGSGGPGAGGGSVTVTGNGGGYGWGYGWGDGGSWGGGGDSSGVRDESGEDWTPPPDCETIDASPTFTPSSSDAAAIDRLIGYTRQALEALGSLPANGAFHFPDGSTALVSELYSLLRRMDFVVVPQGASSSYSVTGGLPGGASIYNDGNPVFEVEITTVRRLGVDWDPFDYLFHELYHITLSGRDRLAGYLLEGSHGAVTFTDDEKLNYEAWTNGAALLIQSAAGIARMPGYSPIFGYLPQLPTYVAPAAPEQKASDAFLPCGG